MPMVSNSPAQPNTHGEQQLRSILDEIEAASVSGPHLADVFERYVAPEYAFTSPAGVVSGRDDIVRALRENTVAFSAYRMSDLDIRNYGSVAVVLGRAEGEGVNPGGEVFRGAYRFTSVWSEGPYGWRLVAWQTTSIA